MRAMVLGVAFLLAWGPALRADDDKDKKDLTPAQEVKKLIADFQKEQQDFYQEYGKLKTAEERNKFVEEKMPKPEKVAVRLLELAEKNAKDDSVVLDALTWVVVQGGNGGESAKAKDKALETLVKYADNAKVGDVCMSLVYNPSPKADKLLRAVMEKGSNDEAKGKATFCLGQHLKQLTEVAQMLKEQPELVKDYEKAYGKDAVAHLQASDPAALGKEAEKLFEKAAEKYASVELYKGHSLKEAAEGELFEIRNLAIGKTAPEIEAEDLDGNKFKLSEYRGKVVVLDFWGNW